MGTYPIQDLLQKWEQATITIEMAIGHILQHLGQLWHDIKTIHTSHIQLTNALNEIQHQQVLLKDELDRLLKHTGLPPIHADSPPKRKRGRPRKKR